MEVRGLAATLLLASALSATSGDTNVTILTLPINLTSWSAAWHETLNRSQASALATRVSSALNDTLGLLRNGSVDCTEEGEECIPGVPSCCPSSVEEEIQCLPVGGVHRCSSVRGSEELAALRLNALEYGDSAGQLESHPWVNSWEFQSRSEAEREELQEAQDEEWRKNWKPSSQENFWRRAYNKIRAEAIDAWKDLRKMRKLKEVKNSLIDKEKKRHEENPTPLPKTVTENPEAQKDLEQLYPHESPGTQKKAKVLYPDELSEETSDEESPTKTESEEGVIQFSDEQPKRNKKLDFRLDDIIKDAVYKVSEKLKKRKGKQGSQPSDKDSSVITPNFSEEGQRLNEIQGTVDNLLREVNELKGLKAQHEQAAKDKEDGVYNIEDKVTGPDIDELIHKHVRNILEERKRLYELRQIEKANRLKHDGGLKV